jgi:hypothetical protein
VCAHILEAYRQNKNVVISNKLAGVLRAGGEEKLSLERSEKSCKSGHSDLHSVENFSPHPRFYLRMLDRNDIFLY